MAPVPAAEASFHPLKPDTHALVPSDSAIGMSEGEREIFRSTVAALIFTEA